MTTWLTAREGAEYVKVSEDTIRAAVKSGDLIAHPIGKGREYRLTTDAIDAWMLSSTWEPRAS